jgi:MFS family permease
MPQRNAVAEINIVNTLLTRWLPSSYYGWRMLTGVAMAQLVSWGVLYYAFSALMLPMRDDLQWDTVTLTGAYSLMLLSMGLAAFPFGRIIDRYGARWLMSTCSLFAVLLVLAWSQVTAVWHFYAVMTGVGVVCAGVLYDPAFALVAVWFRRFRGRALALLTFWGALASVVFIPLTSLLNTQWGWRTALMILAAVLAVVTIPIHVLLVRHHPGDVGALPDGEPPTTPDEPAQPMRHDTSVPAATAVRGRYFMAMTGIFALSTFVGVTLTTHAVPLLVAFDHSLTTAGWVAALFGLMSLTGRVVVGPLVDRIPLWRLLGILLGMQLLGLSILLLAGQLLAGAVLYMVCVGVGVGTITILRAAMLADAYGHAAYATIGGVQNVVFMLFRTVAPLGASLWIGYWHGYSALLELLMALVVLALGGVIWLVRLPHPRHGSVVGGAVPD